MEVPSGRSFDSLDLRIVQLFAQYRFVDWREEEFKLKSGVLSHVYVFGREDLTDHPDLEWLLGRKMAQLVRNNAVERGDLKPQCLIGIPTAGTVLAQAAAMVDHSWERISGYEGGSPRIIHRVMREVLKTHGAHPDWVNGKPIPDHTYWSVDNVVTDAGTKVEARGRFQESGYPVDQMPALVLVDRQQGGIKRMIQSGFSNIVVAYNLLDLTFVFQQLGLWPKNAVQAVAEEIKAHQLVS